MVKGMACKYCGREISLLAYRMITAKKFKVVKCKCGQCTVNDFVEINSKN